MEKKKIGVIPLTIIIVMAMIIGACVAYIIKLEKNQTPQTMQPVREEIVKPQEEIVIEEPAPLPVYDGSKSITVNGETYTISYNSDIYKYDNQYPVVVNLYFNDEKVRSVNMPFYGTEEGSTYPFNQEYEIKLYNISNEYILVVVSNKSELYAYEDAELCVINLDGEYIGSRHWERGAEGVNLKSDGKDLVRYEIYEDGFLIFETSKWGGVFMDAKYVVKDNSINMEQNKFYNSDEIETSGK